MMYKRALLGYENAFCAVTVSTDIAASKAIFMDVMDYVG